MIKLAVRDLAVMYVLLLPLDYMALPRDLNLTIVRAIATHLGDLEKTRHRLVSNLLVIHISYPTDILTKKYDGLEHPS